MPTIPCPECGKQLRVPDDHAGLTMRCPACSAMLTVPAGNDDAPVVEAAEASLEDSTPRSGPSRACPQCGKMIARAARKCRFCRKWIEEADDEDALPSRRATSFEPCPRCNARGARRVTFTFWGSFYGPALFTHVECPECHYRYNGRTGRSNLIPAIVFVTIPALLIAAIVGGMIAILIRAGIWK